MYLKSIDLLDQLTYGCGIGDISSPGDHSAGFDLRIQFFLDQKVWITSGSREVIIGS